MLNNIKSWVVYWKDLKKIYKYSKDNNFAIPAINVVWTSSINAALQAAKEMNLPIIIQFSSGGWKFLWWKWLNTLDSQILWTVVWALHVHTLAEKMWVIVILHTDHANKKSLPWIDWLLLENEKFYIKEGRPLFSSHMLDLSTESLIDNIKISKEYFEKFNKLEMWLEIEIWITWWEEEWADSTTDKTKMYTSPEELYYAYSELLKIWDNFTIAAMFWNVHGVYKSGNVELKPVILNDAQKYIQNKLNTKKNPVDFVFHGWSWSEKEKIKESISYWVVKMNVDTDTQWAFWDWVNDYIKNNDGYMKWQIWNPEWKDLPNKWYYDPWKWLAGWEENMKNRIIQSFNDLNCKS